MTEERLPSKFSFILHADIAGSTALVQQDEDLAHKRIRETFRRFDETITKYHGHVCELRGDALLAEFERASDAVTAALVFQAKQSDYLAQLDDNILPAVRVGIALGEVVIADDTITGAGVVLAQRVEQLAEPGGVRITGAIHEALPQRMPFDQENLGEQRIKGFDEQIRVYTVSLRPGISMPEPESPRPSEAVAINLPEKPSIAVLPFTNMSGDPEQDYLSDGITEEIITALSKLRWFLVIARNSSFVYKGRSVDVTQVGRELGVQYVLEGSIRKAGDRLRISAQMVDAMSGVHHWAQKYDRELSDFFELQDDITQSVTAAIEPKLVAAESARSQNRSFEELSAWDLTTRAMAHCGRMTSEDSAIAINTLHSAVEKYPNYGPAHSLLAFSLLVSNLMGWAPESNEFNFAAELARRAAQLDDEDPWAHLALGYVAFTRRQTKEAVKEYTRALDLNPNFATAYGYLGWALAFDGQSDEAIGYFELALRMSPHDPLKAFFYSGTGAAHYMARRYEDAVEWAQNAIRERPEFTPGRRILCASLAQSGRADEASEELKTLRKLQTNLSIKWIEQHVPYTARAMPHFIEGMRKAGLD